MALEIDLDGRVALISGGGTGIGKGIARAFLEAAGRVAIGGRRRRVLEDCAAALSEETGGEVLAVAGDVSKAADCARMVARTLERFGKLEVLINNAGVARHGALEETPEEAIHAMIDVDLKGPIFLTRAALGELRKAGGRASILNISSSVTVAPVRSYSVYSAAKAGLEQLTRCWALDLAAAGIRVNAIAPGIVRTPVFESMMPAESIDGFLEQFAEVTPLGRVGEPEDIARLAVFLASDLSSWTTGALVTLDGGLSMASNS